MLIAVVSFYCLKIYICMFVWVCVGVYVKKVENGEVGEENTVHS